MRYLNEIFISSIRPRKHLTFRTQIQTKLFLTHKSDTVCYVIYNTVKQ